MRFTRCNFRNEGEGGRHERSREEGVSAAPSPLMHRHVFVRLPEHVSQVERIGWVCSSLFWQELLERREAEIRAKVLDISVVWFLFVFMRVCRRKRTKGERGRKRNERFKSSSGSCSSNKASTILLQLIQLSHSTLLAVRRAVAKRFNEIRWLP